MLKALAKLTDVQVFDEEATWAHAAEGAPVGVVGAARICLKVEIDAAAERLRLGREIARLQAETAKAHAKLDNAAFVAKAPPAVIEQEHARAGAFADTLQKMQQQLARLAEPSPVIESCRRRLHVARV